MEKLLKDPRYGERWAKFWLDLARYADTAGYEATRTFPTPGVTVTMSSMPSMRTNLIFSSGADCWG